jgi:hypothetical protein
MNSKVGEKTCNTIFHEFVTNFSKHYYEDYVDFPDPKKDKKYSQIL